MIVRLNVIQADEVRLLNRVCNHAEIISIVSHEVSTKGWVSSIYIKMPPEVWGTLQIILLHDKEITWLEIKE